MKPAPTGMLFKTRHKIDTRRNQVIDVQGLKKAVLGTAQNNPHKWVILQTNRPLIRNKLNLKTKRYSWKVIEGDIKNQRAFEETIEVIEKYLDDHPDTPKL